MQGSRGDLGSLRNFVLVLELEKDSAEVYFRFQSDSVEVLACVRWAVELVIGCSLHMGVILACLLVCSR